jgi:hypothetical protein
MSTSSKMPQAYLIVADNTSEFQAALRYGAQLAKSRKAHLFVLKIIDSESFQHWGKIEEQMKRELRHKAEQELWDTARKINELCDITPVLYISDEKTEDAVMDVLNDTEMVKLLILAGKTEGGNPGPLVSYFSGKGLSRLKIPLVVIPGNLEAGMISPLI